MAAIFEWIVALIFTFYVLSFLLDLWPSVRSKRHVPQGWQEQEAARLEKEAERNGGLTSFNDGPAPDRDEEDGNYRGTNMTAGAGQGSHLQGAAAKYPPEHNDLGRQKKWGIGKYRF